MAGLTAIVLQGCWSDIPTLDAGRELYQSSGCASCHGNKGHGDGPAAKNLLIPPTDFREASHFLVGADEAAIARTILLGVMRDPTGALTTQEQMASVDGDQRNSHHQMAMPSFEHLTETERRSIAQYVVSIRTTKH